MGIGRASTMGDQRASAVRELTAAATAFAALHDDRHHVEALTALAALSDLGSPITIDHREDPDSRVLAD